MQTNELLRDHRPIASPTPAPPEPEGDATEGVLAYLAAKPTGPTPRRVVITLALIAGAGLVATTGAIHLHLWASGYRTVPTIGPLFLFQGIAGAALAVALVASRRLLTVVAGAGFMIATIGGFLLSVYVGLFGFMDTLAAPFAGVSLAVESAGALVLSAVGAMLLIGRIRS